MTTITAVVLFTLFAWLAALALVVGIADLDEGEPGRAVLNFVAAGTLAGFAVLTTVLTVVA